MKYHCGHEGCDICGARQCTGAILHQSRAFIVCDRCEREAVSIVVGLSERLGETIIDPSKDCGKLSVKSGDIHHGGIVK